MKLNSVLKVYFAIVLAHLVFLHVGENSLLIRVTLPLPMFVLVAFQGQFFGQKNLREIVFFFGWLALFLIDLINAVWHDSAGHIYNQPLLRGAALFPFLVGFFMANQQKLRYKLRGVGVGATLFFALFFIVSKINGGFQESLSFLFFNVMVCALIGAAFSNLKKENVVPLGFVFLAVIAFALGQSPFEIKLPFAVLPKFEVGFLLYFLGSGFLFTGHTKLH